MGKCAFPHLYSCLLSWMNSLHQHRRRYNDGRNQRGSCKWDYKITNILGKGETLWTVNRHLNNIQIKGHGVHVFLVLRRPLRAVSQFAVCMTRLMTTSFTRHIQHSWARPFRTPWSNSWPLSWSSARCRLTRAASHIDRTVHDEVIVLGQLNMQINWICDNHRGTC